MKKILKKSIIAASTLTILCSTAFAAEIPYSVEYDYMNNAVTISGTLDASAKHIALQILTEGKSFDDLAKDPENSALLLYRYQKDITDGKFSFTVEYDELTPSTYAAKLVTDGKEDPTEFGVKLVDGEAYAAVLTELKGFADAKDYNGFKNCIETKYDELGFDVTLYDTLTDTSALKPYMDYISTQTLDPEQSDANVKDFNSYVLMAALEEDKVSNIKSYLENSSFSGSQVAADFIKLADTTAEQEYATSKMTGKTIESFSAFEDILKEGLILSEVRYASGYGGVQSILTKYGSVIGVTGTASSDVYKAMSGKDYADGDALSSAYKSLASSSSSAGRPSGGGGGGSSSGGGSSNPTYMNATYPTGSQAETPEKFYNYFHDIDGVGWAVEAILALADKEIVNGKSEGYFKPNDDITREEFAKILVCALGYQNDAYSGNVFADVNEGDWFCSYVNIAYNKGLLQGVGDRRFGTGELISRQDMMVMLCNAFESHGVVLPTGTLTFEDSDKIADYAVEAVGALYEMGIINGVSETEFDPLGSATRAQAAKVVYGFLQQLQ